MKIFNQTEKVLCVGIGGYGCDAISHISKSKLLDIEFIAMDTDPIPLSEVDDVMRMQISSQYLNGFSNEFIYASHDEVKSLFQGADLIFIVTKLDGSTATKATPIIAKIAKEVAALTITFVAMPSIIDNSQKPSNTDGGIKRLRDYDIKRIKRECDAVVLIQEEELLTFLDKNIIGTAINGIMGVLLTTGDNDITLAFEDIQTVMRHNGEATISVGEYEGENAADKAMNEAINNLSNISLSKVTGILVHFSVHPDFPIMELGEAMEIVNESIHEEADVIFGTLTDEILSKDFVRVTMIATGFERLIINNNEHKK